MNNIIVDKSFQLALKVISVYQFIVSEQKEYSLGRQLLRSGTAVGAMVREAQNAESRADFIHKMAIAQKECDETLYWLELLKASGYLDQLTFHNTNSLCTEVFKIIRSIIITTKTRKSN